MQNRLRLEGQLSKLQRVPEEPPPTNGHISDVLHVQTRATHPRHRHSLVSACLASPARHRPRMHLLRCNTVPTRSMNTCRRSAMPGAVLTGQCAQAGVGGSRGCGRGAPAHLTALLQRRETNQLGSAGCGMSAAQRCHVGAFLRRPGMPVACIDRMHSRAYIGQFSGAGDVFVGAPGVPLSRTPAGARGAPPAKHASPAP